MKNLAQKKAFSSEGEQSRSFPVLFYSSVVISNSILSWRALLTRIVYRFVPVRGADSNHTSMRQNRIIEHFMSYFIVTSSFIIGDRLMGFAVKSKTKRLAFAHDHQTTRTSAFQCSGPLPSVSVRTPPKPRSQDREQARQPKLQPDVTNECNLKTNQP